MKFRRTPGFARVGTMIHDKILNEMRTDAILQGLVELEKKQDYKKYRDKGFSIEKSIKDSNGKSIKVYDKKKKKNMISIPDFIDYSTNLIVDLKTVHDLKPPDDEGIFDTVVHEVEILDDYENATVDFFKGLVDELEKKYSSQINRYKKAYYKATGRNCIVEIFPLAYKQRVSKNIT